MFKHNKLYLLLTLFASLHAIKISAMEQIMEQDNRSINQDNRPTTSIAIQTYFPVPTGIPQRWHVNIPYNPISKTISISDLRNEAQRAYGFKKIRLVNGADIFPKDGDWPVDYFKKNNFTTVINMDKTLGDT